MMKVTPFETYQSYLSMKSHFTNRKYDFFRYGGKSRATMASFNKRKDKYWFEKTSRKYSDGEIVDFLLANFVTTDNPKNLWIGEIINSGERTYADWMRRKQSISYLFKEESQKLLEENELVELFECGKGHPIILKRFLGGCKTKKNNLRRIMLAVSIVFAAFLFILFLIVGVIGGWVARDYMMNYQEVEKIHPEMYDRNGNIVPDEIVAFRFENYDNNSEEDDD